MKLMLVFSCCLVGGAVAAGCGGGSAGTHTTTEVGVLAGRGLVAGCDPSGLTLSLGPRVSPMTGEHADLFVLTNVSRRTCVLDGYPRVTLSNDGKPLPFVYRADGGPYVTRRAPRGVMLQPRRHAYFLVAKYRCDGGILSAATAIRVLLPATAAGAMTLREPGVGIFDYCKQYPGDQAIDPGNRVAVSPIAASTSATVLP